MQDNNNANIGKIQNNLELLDSLSDEEGGTADFVGCEWSDDMFIWKTQLDTLLLPELTILPSQPATQTSSIQHIKGD